MDRMVNRRAARYYRALAQRQRNEARELHRSAPHGSGFHALYGQLVESAGHADDIGADLELRLLKAG